MRKKTNINHQNTSPSIADLFTPKLMTVLKDGYNLKHFRTDAVAGLTVAIVALPLSMAIAIAAGASPAQGLYTAIIGGFIVSILGGSRFQIGGPAGAFIVLIASTIKVHGMEGLILATLIAGIFLLLIGFFRLGTYIKFIPYPVTVGFTTGIAIIIFASQIKELFGLTLTEQEPGPLLEKLPIIWKSLPSVDITTVLLSFATIAVIGGIKKLKPHWPGMLIAVVGSAVIAAFLNLPIETIGTKFGGIPSTLPLPIIPQITYQKVLAVLPSAVAFALLGSIESLLSAVVADGMTGRRHRSNCELVAQGVANIASGMFGGICVTGTIARTATNIRAGAHGPVSGILHSVFLLIFILIAAPLASYIPLACLAGVLAVVAWNMVEARAFAILLQASRGDAAVLLSTFLLTIFRDLTEAIVVGFALGAVLFIHRMSETTAIETHAPFVAEDMADDVNGDRVLYDEKTATDPNTVIYRISGAFFFGAAASIGSVLDQIADTHRVLIIDFTAVPFLDSTAANTLDGLVEKANSKRNTIYLTGTSHVVRQELFAYGVKPPLVSYQRSIKDALAASKRITPIDLSITDLLKTS